MYIRSRIRGGHRPPAGRRWSAVVLAAAVAVATGAASAQAAVPQPHPAASPASAATVSWSADLAHPGAQQVNLGRSAQDVRIADPRFRLADAPARGYAEDLLAPTTLSRPVGQVTAVVTGPVPAGAAVTVDVRGRAGAGPWTEWRTASGGSTAVLGGAQTTVQARITLTGNAAGAGPVVSAVRFTGVAAAASGPAAGAPSAAVAKAATADSPIEGSDPESYRVFATDEGVVGGTTANGHVVQANDHFVALPSGTALSPAGSDEYSVKVCGPVGCETAPVWDVGPWNTKDDYWDPASSRQEFTNLPQGTPESAAAYSSGYNGGLDDLGYKVLNPAGIDLADGTFHDVLGSDNGYVTVTYLWTSGGSSSAAGFPSSPLVQYGQQLQVFGRDGAGATYSKVYTPGSGWSGWSDLGGVLADDPVALEYDTRAYGQQMQVYGRAASGATYSDVYSATSGWSGWQDIGGTIADDPVAIQYGQQMEVYGIAASGATYSDVYTPGSGWSGWQNLGGNLTGDLSVVVYGSQLQVYGRDNAGATYSKVYMPGSGWSGWTDLGGTIADNPVAIQYGSQMQVYGRAAGGATYSDVYTPGSGWSGWQNLGGNLVGEVTPVVYGSQLQVFGRDSAGAAYSKVYTPGSGWSGWSDLGGTLSSDPTPIEYDTQAYGPQMQVYGRAASGATYADVYSAGSGWSGWTDEGGDLLP